MQSDIVYGDVFTFLKYAKSSNYDLVYLTARSNKKALLNQLKQLQLDKYATDVIIVDPYRASKEKTSVLQQSSAFAFIGDTEADYEAAINSFTPFYALNRGFRSKTYWDSKGISSYDSLTQLVNNNFI